MKSADYLPVLSKWGTRRKKTTGVRGTRYDSFEVFKAALVVSESAPYLLPDVCPELLRAVKKAVAYYQLELVATHCH